MRVFATATHILKLKQYREDWHGLCARMTGKFMKGSKVLAVSSDHAATTSPYCRYVGLQKKSAVCWFELHQAKTCYRHLMKQSGRGEKDQMTGTSIPPQTKSLLLLATI